MFTILILIQQCDKLFGETLLPLSFGMTIDTIVIRSVRYLCVLSITTNFVLQEGTMNCERDTCPVLDCPERDQIYDNANSCCASCKPKLQFLQCETAMQTYKVCKGCATPSLSMLHRMSQNRNL